MKNEWNANFPQNSRLNEIFIGQSTWPTFLDIMWSFIDVFLLMSYRSDEFSVSEIRKSHTGQVGLIGAAFLQSSILQKLPIKKYRIAQTRLDNVLTIV